MFWCPVCATVLSDDGECWACGTKFWLEERAASPVPDLEGFFGAVVFCPRCCGPNDADGWGVRVLECGSCAQVFTVELLGHIVAAHALYG